MTPKQKESFKMGRFLIDSYVAASKDHQEPTINKSVIAGDLIADIMFTMSRVWEYPLDDIKSVITVAFDSLCDDSQV